MKPRVLVRPFEAQLLLQALEHLNPDAESDGQLFRPLDVYAPDFDVDAH